LGFAATSVAACRRSVSALRFGQLNAIDATIPRLADARGYFTENRIAVNVSLQPSGAAIVQNMSSVTDALDLGVMGLPPLCAMIKQNRLRPVVLATVSGSPRTCQLLTFHATGITSDPSTLKGRTVGYTLNTVSHQYLYNLLERANLSFNEIKAFPAPQSALIDSLIHGDLDAVVLWEPNLQIAIRQYISRVKNRGNAIDRGEPVLLADPSVLYVTTHIVAHPEAVRNSRPSLTRFLRALVDANVWLDANRAAAQQSIAQWVDLPVGDLDSFFGSSNFRVRLELAKLQADLRNTFRWLAPGDPQAALPPDFSRFLDSSLLREIDSARVIGE
jgi:ABC-type nitrate/sulfonate/bicarbonate transport system substrate-binding protein